MRGQLALAEHESRRVRKLKTAAAIWLKTREAADSFVHSKFYIAFLAIAAYLLWQSENLLAAIAVFAALACLTLILVRDGVSILPLVLIAPCVVHIDEMPGELWQYALAAVPAVVGLAVHIAVYRRNKLDKSSFNLLPMAALVAAMLLSGLFSSAVQDKAKGLTAMLYVGVLPLMVYLFIKLYGEDKCAYGDYAAASVVIWGVLIAAQAITLYVQAAAEGIDISSNDYMPELGWAGSNVFTTALMLCIAFNFYYMSKSWKFLLPFALLTGVQFACMLYAHSRGALIFTIIVLAAGVIALTVYNRKNPLYWAVAAALAAVLILTLTFYWEKITLIIGNTFSDKMQTSGRDYLYIEAMDKFLQNPLFGAGMGYLGYNSKLQMASGVYPFHSTVFQTLGSMGLAGTAAMIWLYISRYYTVLSARKAWHIFFFVGMLGVEGYAIIDTATFEGLPFMTTIYMILAVMELERQLDKGQIKLGCTLKELAAAGSKKWKRKKA